MPDTVWRHLAKGTRGGLKKGPPPFCDRFSRRCCPIMEPMMRGGGAVAVVYVDSVFVLNALMDYLLLLCTGRLAGVTLRRRRYALGAVLGGAYAVAVFLPGCGFLSLLPVKLAAGVLLSVIAFGAEARLLRLTLLLFAVSCAMAGCVLGLGLLAGSGVPVVRGVFYTDVSAKVLLIAAAAAYLVLTVVFRAAARHGLGGQLVRVRVYLGGRSAALTALLDTGSALRDPVTGAAVLVVSPGAMDGALPSPVRRLLTPELLRFPPDLLEPLRQTDPALRWRLVPYRAVGVPEGLLLAVRSDWTEIEGERYPGLTVAFSPTALGPGYAALWGGQVKRRGKHGKMEGVDQETSGAAGALAGAGAALHRRQRYPAAASEPGAGGGTAGPAGPGGCPQGADRT